MMRKTFAKTFGEPEPGFHWEFPIKKAPVLHTNNE